MKIKTFEAKLNYCTSCQGTINDIHATRTYDITLISIKTEQEYNYAVFNYMIFYLNILTTGNT